MSAVAEQLVGEGAKARFIPIFMQMNPSDRQYVKHWNVEDIDGTMKVRLNVSLIGPGLMEFIASYVERNRGDYRMYPYDRLICIEMSIPNV